MFKILILKCLILTPLAFSFSTRSYAITDPLAVSSNHFGIHITDDTDIPAAASLVNSQGGDWGYVTLVIRADDRNLGKWQHTFDLLRENHLIPLVRIATSLQGNTWKYPEGKDVAEWVGFLNSLNWVVKNRYVILFNEPNHAKEWGGQLNPEEYAHLAKVFQDELRLASSDYFILPAALDAAAPNGPDTLSLTEYLKRMYQAEDQLFAGFDGWNSHSYPNPGFSASPYRQGLVSIRGYQEELSLAKHYGLKNDAPVFITETGWKHNLQGLVNDGLSVKTVDQHFKTAFEKIWLDPNLVAITPFILNYPDFPFSQFSWRQSNSGDFLPWYGTVQNLPKTKGEPLQHHLALASRLFFPEEIITNQKYQSKIQVQNLGQSIWDSGALKPIIDQNPRGLNFIIGSNPNPVKPGQITFLPVTMVTDNQFTTHNLSWHLEFQDQSINPSQSFALTVSPPNVITSFKIWLYQSIHQDTFQLVD